ncbi:MAG: hypothetical protein QOH49_2978 [Acidobacteriota bacterium]|jgi:hypothetical protein|nr:hypothetical protein [Acidobacteriota bacterium]
MTYVQRITCGVVFITLAFMLGACASMARPAGAERPRGNEPPRFAVLAASEERRTAALVNWKAIVGEQAANASPTPELHVVTATLSFLPAGLQDFPRLPLVAAGDAKSRTEEETRESLRRFLSTAAPLLGIDLKQLSLDGVGVEAGISPGAKSAIYLQNSFPYPLRNGYGIVSIVFTPDLRVVRLSSTAIPDAERLARTLATVPKTVTAAQAAAALANRAVTYNDRAGAQQTRTLSQLDTTAARQLVVFPLRRDTADPAALELHVAWEVAAGSTDAPLLVYVDAANGDVLGAEARP